MYCTVIPQLHARFLEAQARNLFNGLHEWKAKHCKKWGSDKGVAADEVLLGCDNPVLPSEHP